MEIVQDRAEGTREVKRFMKLARLKLKMLHKQPRNQNWGHATVNQRMNWNGVIRHRGIDNTVPEQVTWKWYTKMINVLITTIAVRELEALITYMLLLEHSGDNGGGRCCSGRRTSGDRCITSWQAVLDPSRMGFCRKNGINVQTILRCWGNGAFGTKMGDVEGLTPDTTAMGNEERPFIWSQQLQGGERIGSNVQRRCRGDRGGSNVGGLR